MVIHIDSNTDAVSMELICHVSDFVGEEFCTLYPMDSCRRLQVGSSAVWIWPELGVRIAKKVSFFFRIGYLPDFLHPLRPSGN
jgi:hypothetical protein